MLTPDVDTSVPAQAQRRMRPLLGVLVVSLCCGVRAVAVAGETPIHFARDIRPILSENCYPCHGPDESNRKADLRLDARAGAFADRGGYALITPGRPDESPLYFRISTETPRLHMPPPASGRTLTVEQIQAIRRWIEEGATWVEHWSFIPPSRPTPPAVRDAKWPRNPMDNFILARLEAEGLRPANRADRRTLIRRVTLDLTGLPPTREEVRQFLADESPDAYEKLVDRLLAKPQ
jgi:hypothetical protein